MKRILIIEDDEISQDFMRRIFKKDYEVDLCDSSEEYYEKFSKVKYNVMIVDVSIKGAKTGLDLIKSIKESSLQKDTPIVCLTAHANIKTRQTAIESGTDLFFTKPVSNKILKEAVASLIK